MAVSRRTADKLAFVLHRWAQQHHVPGEAMLDLLDTLTRVPGNQSYRESVAALRGRYAELARGRQET